jgi:hypothetical protein
MALVSCPWIAVNSGIKHRSRLRPELIEEQLSKKLIESGLAGDSTMMQSVPEGTCGASFALLGRNEPSASLLRHVKVASDQTGRRLFPGIFHSSPGSVRFGRANVHGLRRSGERFYGWRRSRLDLIRDTELGNGASRPT